MYSTTGGGTLLPYTMVTGGTSTSAAVAIGMTTEFKNNIYSFYYVFTILQGLPTTQRQRQRQRQQQQVDCVQICVTSICVRHSRTIEQQMNVVM